MTGVQTCALPIYQQTKHQFQNDKQLNEIRRKSIEYAIIKLKWEQELTPITNIKVDLRVLKEEGYL